MSSIRIFILSALADHGPMHGHQLRLLAEEEHIDWWTDISVGALYGAIKRLAADELIEELRVEREGNYPQRQVWGITLSGRRVLSTLRTQALRQVVVKPDPFDLALARLDVTGLDALPLVIAARIATLEGLLGAERAHMQTADAYLTVAERWVLSHRIKRVEAEIAWHLQLQADLHLIVEDERSRRDST